MKPTETLSPLLRKLRYAPDMQVYVAGAPVGFETELRAAKVSRAQRPGKSVGLVLVFSTRRSQVVRTLAALDGKLAPGTIVWLCYPKAKALETDLKTGTCCVRRQRKWGSRRSRSSPSTTCGRGCGASSRLEDARGFGVNDTPKPLNLDRLTCG